MSINRTCGLLAEDLREIPPAAAPVDQETLLDAFAKRLRLGKLASLIAVIVCALLLVSNPTLASAGSSESEVRATVERIFQSLKDKNYEGLYDTLPAGSRSRISRERFASSLRRTQDAYALDQMEVGNVKVSGNFAVVDTVLYGRLLKPFDMEGKIVVQQYLVREDGNWKVATGDNATIQRFLKSNPAFARQFKIRPPRVFVKKDGSWVEFTPPKRQRQA